jgi:hypothetical protein
MKLTNLRTLFFLTIFIMSTTISKAAANAQITYNVSFPEAQAHYADIEMHITGLQQNTLELKMPVWTPGSYLVREFAKNIESLTAQTNGKPVAAPKTNKNTWQIVTKGISSVTVKYRVQPPVFSFIRLICCTHQLPSILNHTKAGIRFQPASR